MSIEAVFEQRRPPIVEIVQTKNKTFLIPLGTITSLGLSNEYCLHCKFYKGDRSRVEGTPCFGVKGCSYNDRTVEWGNLLVNKETQKEFMAWRMPCFFVNPVILRNIEMGLFDRHIVYGKKFVFPYLNKIKT